MGGVTDFPSVTRESCFALITGLFGLKIELQFAGNALGALVIPIIMLSIAKKSKT